MDSFFCSSLNNFCISSELEVSPIEKKGSFSHNITQRQRNALSLLRGNNKLVIKEADKGTAIVIMNSTYYERKAEEILGDDSSYEKINSNDDSKIMKTITELTNKFTDELTDQEKKYLTKFEFKTSNFYGLPKIHRSQDITEAIQQQKTEVINILNPVDLKLRPIIAGPVCPTHRLSHFIDIILQPFAKEITAYVKDNFDVLRKLPKEVTDDTEMATLDVENLYGNITHEIGLEAVKFWLETCPREMSRISNDFILSGIRLILENNTFHFNGIFYKQLKGTAMGTKMAPMYATLTLGYLEKKLYASIYNDYNFTIYENFVKYYFRYLDDVLVIYDRRAMSINNINYMLNSVSNDLNFKLETVGDEVNFLDIRILKKNNTLETDLFTKSTDTKQYLNFQSNHPRHVKRALPYNLARRICTIVSQDEIKMKRLHELKSNLLKCNYPLLLINDGIEKALSYSRTTLLNPIVNSSKNTNENIVHVSTYDPNVTSNSELIQKLFNELQKNESTRNAFQNKKLIFSKRQPPNLKNILTRAEFVGKPIIGGVSKCSKPRCKICEIIISDKFFYFAKTKYNFCIKSNMSCDTKNCIYLLQCAGCQDIYIGETNNFRLRINLHKDHASKNIGLNVSRHIFQCTEHRGDSPKFFAMPFFKITVDNIYLRRNMESYFINKFCPQLNRLH